MHTDPKLTDKFKSDKCRRFKIFGPWNKDAQLESYSFVATNLASSHLCACVCVCVG